MVGWPAFEPARVGLNANIAKNYRGGPDSAPARQSFHAFEASRSSGVASRWSRRQNAESPLTAWAVSYVDAKPLSAFGDRGMRRFWLRTLLAPRVAWRWRAHAHGLYREHGAAPPSSQVLLKPLHGYLRRGLNPATRLGVLADHYRWFGRLFVSDCLRSLCAGEPLELARLSGRKNTRFRLCLVNATTVQTPREGECTICLTRDGDPTPLSRLTFSLGAFDGSLVLAIGGLQGPSPGHKREVIEATRDLHGLRPKDATLLAARAIAEGLSAVSVHAVRDALHVHKTLADHPKLSSYDNYWRERGAIAGGPLGFILPPLAAIAVSSKGREGMKFAVAEGARRFVAANRRGFAAKR
jgi:uncharacterized protein VirK/YbjX